MIPGYHATYFELFADINSDKLNNKYFNPYDPSHISNQIGDLLDDADRDNTIWNETSEFLYKCRYKQFKNFAHSTDGELQVCSLNIQTLLNKIPELRENVEDYQKFDVLCFSETNLNLTNFRMV